MSSTKNYSGSKKGAARFARKIVEDLSPDCVSIMTTIRDISGDSYVSRAIVGQSADIARQMEKSFSEAQPTTSPAPTLAM